MEIHMKMKHSFYLKEHLAVHVFTFSSVSKKHHIFH